MKYIYCFLFILFIVYVDCDWELTNSNTLNCNSNLRGNRILVHQEYVIASFDTMIGGSQVGEQMVLMNNVTFEIYDTLNFTYEFCNFMLDLDNYNSTHFLMNCVSRCTNNIRFYTIENNQFVVADELTLNAKQDGTCGIRLVNKDQSNPNIMWFAGNAVTSNDGFYEFDVNSFTMNHVGGVVGNNSFFYYYGGVVNSNAGYGAETLYYDSDYLGRDGAFRIAQLKNSGDNDWNVINKVLPIDFYNPPLIFESKNFKNNEVFLVTGNSNGELSLTNFNFVDLSNSGQLTLTGTEYPEDGPIESKQTQDYIFIVGKDVNARGKPIISRISFNSNGQFDELIDQCLIDQYIYDFAVSDEGRDIFVINYCGIQRYSDN